MEGYSIDAQLENLRRYCLQRGFVITKEYVGEGISAKNIKGRPNLLSLLQEAESGLFKAVIVWKLSRLSRKQKDLLEIVERLARLNVAYLHDGIL